MIVIDNYCSKCGTKVRTQAKFCEGCGQKIQTIEEIKTQLKNDIEQEIKIKTRNELLAELQAAKERTRQIQAEKERELKKSQRPFKKDIIIITAIAIAISIFLILLTILGGEISFNELFKVKEISGNTSYLTTSGLPLKFLTISNTPATNHLTIITCNYVNLILDFILFFACFFIFIYLIVIILIKRKVLNREK